MGWKPEVFVEGGWSRNSLVFRTEAEALASANELAWRWVNVEDTRAVEVVGEPATHVFVPDEVGLSCNRPLPRDP
jgi:hypothetical protein